MYGSDIVSNEKDEIFIYMLIIEFWILYNFLVFFYFMNVIWYLFIFVDFLCVRDSDRISVYLVIYFKYVFRNFMLVKYLIILFLVLFDCMWICKISFFFIYLFELYILLYNIMFVCCLGV